MFHCCVSSIPSPRNLWNASQVSTELFLAEREHYLSVCVSMGLSWDVCVSMGLSWDGESVLDCHDIWRGLWVRYCIVRLDGCKVLQEKVLVFCCLKMIQRCMYMYH